MSTTGEADRVCMTEKDWCPGPDQPGNKCFHCSSVETGRAEYLPPGVDRRECVAGHHWCSGPEGLRAVCEDCEQARDDR